MSWAKASAERFLLFSELCGDLPHRAKVSLLLWQAVVEPNAYSELVGEDLRHEDRVRRARWGLRLAAALLLLLVLWGHVGGAWGYHEIQDRGLRLQYEKKTRTQAETEWAFQIPVLTDQDLVLLKVFSSDISSLEVESISPEPDTTGAGAQTREYQFRVVPGSTSIEVVLRLQIHKIGWTAWQVKSGDAELDFEQLVLP